MVFFRFSLARISLCCFAFALLRGACLAQSPRPEAEDAGHLWLVRARQALARHQTITAVVHQRIHLYEQELVGSGHFVQGPPGKNLLHFDIRLKVGNHDSYCQQRCDGQYYWLQKFEDGLPKVTRIDLSRVAAVRAAAASKQNSESTPAAGGGVPGIGLGGVASLLDQLDKWCVFPRVTQGKLPSKGKLPVYVLEGGWRTERLLHWLPDQAKAVAAGESLDLSKLPPMLPDRVVVFLGRDDLFPRRIEYFVSQSRLVRREREPLVQLHFDDVRFDVQVDARYFTFPGGIVPAVDDTDGYLIRNGLAAPPEKAAPAG